MPFDGSITYGQISNIIIALGLWLIDLLFSVVIFPLLIGEKK